MQNRTRNINISFRVDEQERQAIDSQFARSGIKSIGAYLRSAAMYCEVLKIDMKSIDNYSWQVSAIGNNINQIAKRVNMSGNIKESDIEYLIKSLDEIKVLTNKIYSSYC